MLLVPRKNIIAQCEWPISGAPLRDVINWLRQSFYPISLLLSPKIPPFICVFVFGQMFHFKLFLIQTTKRAHCSVLTHWPRYNFSLLQFDGQCQHFMNVFVRVTQREKTVTTNLIVFFLSVQLLTIKYESHAWTWIVRTLKSNEWKVRNETDSNTCAVRTHTLDSTSDSTPWNIDDNCSE